MGCYWQLLQCFVCLPKLGENSSVSPNKQTLISLLKTTMYRTKTVTEIFTAASLGA